MGLFGKGFNGAQWSDRLGSLASGLGAAQSYWDGDFDTGARIMGLQQNRAEAARRQAEEARRRQAAIAAGVPELLADDPAALRQKLMPEPVQPPAFVKNLEAWRQMTPDQQAEVAQMQNTLQPSFFRGEDGRQYQNQPAQVGTPAPWHDNPDEWEMIPDPQGGGAGNGAGGFHIPFGNPLDPNLGRRRR